MSILSGPAGLLGIGGDHGDYYQNGSLDNTGTKSLASMLSGYGSANVTGAGNKLQAGGSLADAMAGLSPEERNALATSPIYSQLVASQQVQNDPLTSGLLGKGGQLNQATDEATKLANTGYNLTPEDHTAYGQASGNIARQFGQSENSLAQSLAARGMSGSNGAAAQFSGLNGNKNEMLAQAQTNIANQRMQNNLARLTETRNYATSLGNLGQNAENSAANRNMAGQQNEQGLANNLSAAQRGDYGAAEGAKQASMTSQQGAKTQNLGDAYSSGLFQGVQGAMKSGVTGAASAATGMPPVPGK